MARLNTVEWFLLFAFCFSVSDCWQLSLVPRGGKRKQRRTLGGITGLSDISLLPQLYTKVEDRNAKELMLMTALTLQRLDGLRPVGICSDHLENDFPTIVSILEATQPPGTLRYVRSPAEVEVNAWLVEGCIVVDAGARRV